MVLAQLLTTSVFRDSTVINLELYVTQTENLIVKMHSPG